MPIHPSLMPLLVRMGNGQPPSALVAPIMRDWYEDARAKRTREHLARAGVTRPRLTENTATTMMVGFRSWRDTGITWLAIAGVDVAKVQRRAGHDHVGTTMTYVKAAEDLGGTIGEPFPPLPFALIGSLEKANQEPTSTSRLTRRRDAKEESGGEGGIRNRERA